SAATALPGIPGPETWSRPQPRLHPERRAGRIAPVRTRVRSLAAQAFQYPVERVEAGVVDHQLALVAASVLDADLRAQDLGQLVLEPGDVGRGRALRRRLAATAGRHLARRELRRAVLDLAHRPALLRGFLRQLRGEVGREGE